MHYPPRLNIGSGSRLRQLEDDNRRLSDALNTCLEDLSQIRAVAPRPHLVGLELYSFLLTSSLSTDRLGQPRPTLALIQMGIFCQAIQISD